MADMLLSVSNLTVSVGKKKLLENISFSAKRNQILGLFGDSGSGKTTLLLSIFGLANPRFRVTGDIVFNGTTLAQVPSEKRSLAGMSIVLQGLGLFYDRTVFENVAYPLWRRGMARDEIVQEVNRGLALLEIGDLAGRMPGQISGGQRQRVALARALVYRPQLLLLDEPLRGLQDELKLQFLSVFRALAAAGTALIFVTHERSELELTAHSLVKLSGGRIQSHEQWTQGSPFRSLASTSLIPDEANPGSFIRVTALSISTTGQAAVTGRQIVVVVIEWRTLHDGRLGAFVTFSNGQSGWLLFERSIIGTASPPLGNTRVNFVKEGDVS